MSDSSGMDLKTVHAVGTLLADLLLMCRSANFYRNCTSCKSSYFLTFLLVLGP